MVDLENMTQTQTRPEFSGLGLGYYGSSQFERPEFLFGSSIGKANSGQAKFGPGRITRFLRLYFRFFINKFKF